MKINDPNRVSGAGRTSATDKKSGVGAVAYARSVDATAKPAAGGRRVGVALRRGAAFCPSPALLGRFGPFEAIALVFFVMAFPVQACVSRLAGIHQDRIVHS